MRWIDNHCHLESETADEQIAAARANDVERLITIGTDLEQSRKAIEIARANADVWATVGLHPHVATNGIDGLDALIAEAPEVVAVGECGLDYHYDHSPRATQREIFAEQIDLAKRHDLPLMIHTRDAWEDTFDVLTAEGVPERVVLHCFTGGPDEAARCLELGAVISFSGIVSFKKANDVQEAARACPLDRLMVETDSPYLAPVPHRGRPNQPAFVSHVGEAVAALKGVEPEVIAESTWMVASRFYDLDD